MNAPWLPRWLLLLLVLGTVEVSVAPPAAADDTQPAYLTMDEFQPGAVRIVWKVPATLQGVAQLAPALPESWSQTSERRRATTAAAAVETWTMMCESGSPAGAVIGIDGLEGSLADVLVRVRLVDGTLHRVVLLPVATTTTIPASTSPPPGRTRPVLRYVIVLALAWLLSLTSGARRRGIVLCTLALIVGSLCGHGLGQQRWLRDAVLPEPLPTEVELKRVLGGLLLNTYRAFLVEDDVSAYDILARSVEGEFLNEVYLQHRETLRLGDTEAALSLVDRIDVESIESASRRRDGALVVVASWDAYGSVFHWGHVHFRCNAYKAELILVPSDGHWKMTEMTVLEDERVL